MNKVIPFDIKYKEEIQSGKYKVQTKDGANVRIICWDADERYPIIVVDSGLAYQYTKHGKLMGSENEEEKNLVIIMELKLTDFEKIVLDVFNDIIDDYNMDISQSPESKLKYVDKILKAFTEEKLSKDLPKTELRKEVKNFCDIFKADISDKGIDNWTSLFMTIAAKEIYKNMIKI